MFLIISFVKCSAQYFAYSIIITVIITLIIVITISR